MRLRFSLLVLVAALLVVPTLGASEKPSTERLGQKITLTLTTLEGKKITLADLKEQAVVLVFLSFDCPVSNDYVTRLNELAVDYGPKKVAFLAVLPTSEDSAELARQVKEFKLAFPACRDDKLEAVHALKARTVPEAFVLDAQRVLRYRGRIDDGWSGRLKRKPTVQRQDVQVALDELLAGKKVSEPATLAIGCPISTDRGKPVSTRVTYYRDVLPILQARCQTCHRPGEVGPFSLMTYRQAVNWAEDIKEYTKAGKMPPWKPTGGVEFRDARKMTAKEIETLAAWVDGGTPEGDPKEAPAPVKWTDGWQLGKPDLILTPKEDTIIGATGPDHFRCYVFPTNLPEDKFVVAYEVRPGNNRVVHHTLHFLDTQGRARKLEQAEAAKPKTGKEKDRGPGYVSRMGPGFFPPSGDVGGWAPGITPSFLPEGVGYYLPKGADFVLQMHYHRTGKEERDRTQIGLYFSKKRDNKVLQPIAVPGLFLAIPKDAANFKVAGNLWLADDCTVHTVTPHMHLLGKSIKVTVQEPGGQPFTLIDIPQWEYNWQETYHLKKPLRLKAGTHLKLEAAFDNSKDNPNNPNNPPKQVRFGEQTTDEMCFAFLGVTTENNERIGFRLFQGGGVIRLPGLIPPKQK